MQRGSGMQRPFVALALAVLILRFCRGETDATPGSTITATWGHSVHLLDRVLYAPLGPQAVGYPLPGFLVFSAAAVSECRCNIQLNHPSSPPAQLLLPVISSALLPRTGSSPSAEVGCFLGPAALQQLSAENKLRHMLVSLTCETEGSSPVEALLSLKTFQRVDLHGVTVMHHEAATASAPPVIQITIGTDLRPADVQLIDATSFWTLRCLDAAAAAAAAADEDEPEDGTPRLPGAESVFPSSGVLMEAGPEGQLVLTFSTHQPPAWLSTGSGAAAVECQLMAGGVTTPVRFTLPLSSDEGQCRL